MLTPIVHHYTILSANAVHHVDCTVNHVKAGRNGGAAVSHRPVRDGNLFLTVCNNENVEKSPFHHSRISHGSCSIFFWLPCEFSHSFFFYMSWTIYEREPLHRARPSCSSNISMHFQFLLEYICWLYYTTKYTVAVVNTRPILDRSNSFLMILLHLFTFFMPLRRLQYSFC